MKKLSACFIMTDAISFNSLCQGQLEYFKENSNIDLTLICGGNPKQVKILKSRNVGRVVHLPFIRKPSPLKDVETLIKLFIYLVFNRFDIIVYSTPKALLLGSLASFLTFQKYRVAIVQGRVYENYNSLKKRIFQSFDRLSFLVSHQVLFVSKSLSSVCIDEGLVHPAKAEIIGDGSFNGVNVDYFKPISSKEKNQLRSNLSLAPSDFIVSVVGRICIDKGIKDINHVLGNLTKKNIKFLFVGSFEDEVSEKIVKNIVSNDQGYHIAHSTKVYEIFQISDLHLFLSHREGFGNVAIEAASCGIPTFAYDVVGVKDSVKNNINGQRFKFKDNKSIANAIDNAASDPSFNKQYSSAKDWVIDNFEQTEVWKNYLKFYLKSMKRDFYA